MAGEFTITGQLKKMITENPKGLVLLAENEVTDGKSAQASKNFESMAEKSNCDPLVKSIAMLLWKKFFPQEDIAPESFSRCFRMALKLKNESNQGNRAAGLHQAIGEPLSPCVVTRKLNAKKAILKRADFKVNPAPGKSEMAAAFSTMIANPQRLEILARSEVSDDKYAKASDYFKSTAERMNCDASVHWLSLLLWRKFYPQEEIGIDSLSHCFTVALSVIDDEPNQAADQTTGLQDEAIGEPHSPKVVAPKLNAKKGILNLAASEVNIPPADQTTGLQDAEEPTTDTGVLNLPASGVNLQLPSLAHTPDVKLQPAGPATQDIVHEDWYNVAPMEDEDNWEIVE